MIPTSVTDAIQAALDDSHTQGFDEGRSTGYEEGVTYQQAQDAPTIQALRDQLAECQAQNPPPPPSVKVGMNFPPTAQAFEDRAEVARIYLANGQTDIRKEPEFLRAYDERGIRAYILSTKDTTATNWGKCLGTVPDDCVHYDAAHHEPENDMSAGVWQAIQKVMLPVSRSEGGIPITILMQWTLDAHSGRKPADWIVPAGLADVLGMDFYPTSLAYQAAGLARIQAFMQQAGLSRYLIAEYGVDKTNPTLGASLCSDLRAKTTDAEALAYWSAQDKPTVAKPNPIDYRFNQATADAWYATV